MQAAHAWNRRLHHAMLNIGFIHISADHCVYTHTSSASTSFVAVHVDDMCATASTPAEMTKLKQQLGNLFSLVDMGELTWLLGIAVTRDRAARTISLNQTAYIESIAKHLGLEDAHPVSTPLNPHIILSKDLCPTTDEAKQRMRDISYLTAVGSIMYAAIGT